MSTVRNWILEIGPTYNPNKIISLKGTVSPSIYSGNFNNCDVVNLCVYCETMFGISQSEISKLFSKKTPQSFFGSFNVKHPPMKHSNYVKAVEYYQSLSNILKLNPRN